MISMVLTVSAIGRYGVEVSPAMMPAERRCLGRIRYPRQG
jgi:hypothetical protein